SRRDAARVAFVRLWRAFPPALPTLARVRLQRLSPIGNRRNPPPGAENAANFFPSSTRGCAPRDIRALDKILIDYMGHHPAPLMNATASDYTARRARDV